jgi:RHS repeat-associated protein
VKIPASCPRESKGANYGGGAIDVLPGQYFDKETGLVDNWHRTYDPALGIYRQSDPLGLAAGINTYAYALSNPLSHIDPTGLQVPLVGGAAGGAAAGGLGGLGGFGGQGLPHSSSTGSSELDDALGGKGGQIIWPEGFSPNPKPMQCRIDMPPPKVPPPPKPDCESMFNLAVATCRSMPIGVGRFMCITSATISYGICKKIL